MVPYRPFSSLSAVLCILTGVSAAVAQEVDPIGALLDQVPTPAQQPPSAEAWRPSPAATRPTPNAVTSGTPVKIEDIGKTPDGPLTATDLNYEGRLRSAFQSAQGYQGPLDGRWLVRAGDAQLYVLQLADRGTLEGAWRDLRRPGASGATGFINSITRNGDQLALGFTASPSGGPVSLNLQLLPDGRITGDMTERGVRSSVTMVRQ